jgi:hypothetical protein
MLKNNQFIKLRPYNLGTRIELFELKGERQIFLKSIQLPCSWYNDSIIRQVYQRQFSAMFNLLIFALTNEVEYGF